MVYFTARGFHHMAHHNFIAATGRVLATITHIRYANIITGYCNSPNQVQISANGIGTSCTKESNEETKIKY